MSFRVKELALEDLEANEIVSLLTWVLNTYKRYTFVRIQRKHQGNKSHLAVRTVSRASLCAEKEIIIINWTAGVVRLNDDDVTLRCHSQIQQQLM